MSEEPDFERWYREIWYKFTLVREFVEERHGDAGVVNNFLEPLKNLRAMVRPEAGFSREEKERACRDLAGWLDVVFGAHFR